MGKEERLETTAIGAIGVGYNTFYGTAMNNVIDPATSGPVQGAFEPLVHICTSRQDVMNALNIDASVSVNSPWGSFDDRFKFMSLLQITTTTVVILVEATLGTTTTVTGATFNDSFKDSQTLYKQGGDSYVSSITSGGQFLAAYSFRAYDEETFESIVNSADATFSGFSTQFSANFDTEIQSITNTASVATDFNMKAIGFTKTPVPQTANELVPFVLNFNTVPMDAPQVLEFGTICYTALDDCPPNFSQINAYKQQYTESPSMLVDIDYMAESNLNIIANIASIYDNYSMRSADPDFSTHVTNTQAIRDSIATWRRIVDKDPTNPNVLLPTIDQTQLVVPVAQFALVPASSSREPRTGVPFGDLLEKDIPRGVLPSTISIQSDDNWVTKLATTYTTKDPNDPPFVKTNGHGETGGLNPIIQLGPGEVVTQIGVSWSTFTNLVQITTNRQPTITYGPGVNPIQTWSPPQNGCFVGWAGMCGTLVDALWPVWAIFYPASWGPNPPDITHRLKKGLSYVRSKGMPTLDNILAIIGGWAIPMYPTLRQIYPQKGGWEGWMQVNIALGLTQGFPDTKTYREQSVWDGSNERVDLLLLCDGEPTQIVELKCESFYQDNGSGTFKTFVRAMKKDVAKIVVNGDALNPLYKPALCFVIGLTMVDEVTNYALNTTSWIPYQDAIRHTRLIEASGAGPTYVPALWLHYVGYSITDKGVLQVT
ncbi:hypothetical protein VE04_05699 [Pseudogymnoascus sp. 24MN13]|nr:hypothetical protein VE04_05699 [Pseudogymnoascus sp. 24MN13]